MAFIVIPIMYHTQLQNIICVQAFESIDGTIFVKSVIMLLDIAKKSLMNESDSISAYTVYQDSKLAKIIIDRQ